jgi:formylglycine-generating enzyme required for sulfatase activity
MDPEAANFDCTVNVDDGSCEYPGCTDADAQNYDPGANVDDGSCLFEGDIPGFTFIANNVEGYPEYTHDSSGIRFVHLPGGSFEMGSPEGETGRFTREGPVHTVSLSPFLIAKYEVTQREYESVMGTNPSWCTGNAQLPVEQISWDDIQEFEARTGLQLPSEAQWEYAARGGTSTAFSFGDDCNKGSCDPCAPADDYMWWCGSGRGAREYRCTRPVGDKLPNPFGLHDMHGNVYEWCEDDYDHEFYGKPEALLPDPVAITGSVERVIRGGWFDMGASTCRSAARFYARGRDAVFAAWVIGFRPAVSLP